MDQETDGIWVWVGRKVSERERSEALRNARGFVKKKKYPAFTKVTRVVDGHEPPEFKILFADWKSETKGKYLLELSKKKQKLFKIYFQIFIIIKSRFNFFIMTVSCAAICLIGWKRGYRA